MFSNIFVILIFTKNLHLINSECPPDSIIKPCSCIPSISSYTYQLLNVGKSETINTQQKSIVCEHIHNSSFNLQSVFLKLSLFNNLL
jgi:hypothetical protein